MKLLKLLLIIAIFPLTAISQTIQLQSGLSVSKLNWQINNSSQILFNDYYTGVTFFAGLNYLEKEYFNLSSNIGLIKKGGSMTSNIYDQNGLAMGQKTEEAFLNYISVNTSAEFQLPIKALVFPFISVGPRIDFLTNYNAPVNDLSNINALNKVSTGLLLGAGLRFDISNFQVGLRSDYYLNFNDIASWPTSSNNVGGKVTDNTFTVNISLGYHLNR